MNDILGGISRSTSLRSPEPVPVSALSGNDRGRWQPIETAPKDGSDVLLFEQTAGGPMYRVGYWEDDGTNVHTGKSEAGWSEAESGYTGCILPTDWQPLPEPPEAPNGNEA